MIDGILNVITLMQKSVCCYNEGKIKFWIDVKIISYIKSLETYHNKDQFK